jgi:hypothetical protein
VLPALPHGSIADKMPVARADRKDDHAMNPLPFFLSWFAGWMGGHQQVVVEYLKEEIRLLKDHS